MDLPSDFKLLPRKLLSKHSRYDIRGHEIIMFAFMGKEGGQNVNACEYKGRRRGHVNPNVHT